MWRDSLVWFLIAGVALFALDRWYNREDPRLIVIGPEVVAKLKTQWESQAGKPPSPDELNILLQGYIREEIKVREAQSLGLDQDDVIIRRRLAQKIDFLLKGTDVVEQADEQTLRDFHRSHPQRYRLPERISFRHVFSDSQAEASELSAALNNGKLDWQQAGQPFLRTRQYDERPVQEIRSLFGREFTDDLLMHRHQTGWSPPVRSVYGWHSVMVQAYLDAQALEYEQVSERVRADWTQQQASQLTGAKWQELQAQYRVIVEDAADSQ